MNKAELEAVLKVLQQQNEVFMKKVIVDQQEFFKTVTPSVDNNVTKAVPVFHPFEKEKVAWSNYVLQLEQHFEGNNVMVDS